MWNHNETFSSLAKLQEEGVLEKLGKLADSRFGCGGVLSSPDSVNVALLNNGKVIRFPCEDESSIQEFVDACAVASFGVGEKEVTDLSYRNALKLEPEKIVTSFQLCDTLVLNEVQRLLVPQVRDLVRAQLYKLNVYGPGGHFKAHVDTPRGQEMFGSLVVCLPSRFTGGALSVRHQSKELVCDGWSSNPAQKIQWAAFFSDVEHEVLPVADGYRVTLTYNLYHSEKIGNATQSPFYKELAAALGDPHFMREGGVLGFACRHKYVLTDLNSVESSPLLLKGADYDVYAAAKSLGLSVCCKPQIIAHGSYASYEYVLPAFKDEINSSLGYEDTSCEEILQLLGCEPVSLSSETISWCWKDMISSHLATVSISTYGGTSKFYQAAAIFVAVPKWSAERGSGSCATGNDDVWEIIKKKREKCKFKCKMPKVVYCVGARGPVHLLNPEIFMSKIFG